MRCFLFILLWCPAVSRHFPCLRQHIFLRTVIIIPSAGSRELGKPIYPSVRSNAIKMAHILEKSSSLPQPIKDTSRHWKRRIILLPQSFSGSSAAQCPQYIRTAGSAPYQLIGSLPVFIFQRFPALFLQKDEVGGTLCSLAPYSPFSVWVGVWVKHREPLFLESLRYFYCSSCARSRL